MEFEAAKKYVSILLNHIFDLLFINNLGVNHAEHIFIQVSEILQNNSQLKDWFIELVRFNLLRDEQDMTQIVNRPEWFVDPDLILFVAHATKWQEFEDIAKDRKSKIHTLKTLGNEREFSDLLIDALSDDWQDKDFYRSFDR
jgi:hypothetical protein